MPVNKLILKRQPHCYLGLFMIIYLWWLFINSSLQTRRMPSPLFAMRSVLMSLFSRIAHYYWLPSFCLQYTRRSGYCCSSLSPPLWRHIRSGARKVSPMSRPLLCRVTHADEISSKLFTVSFFPLSILLIVTKTVGQSQRSCHVQKTFAASCRSYSPDGATG